MRFNSGQKTINSDIKQKRLFYKDSKDEPNSSVLLYKYSLRDDKEKSEKSVSLSRKSTIVEKRQKSYAQERPKLLIEERIPDFDMSGEKKNGHKKDENFNSVSFMQHTFSAQKKEVKIKKKFKPGVQIKIHQYLSIAIRKYRYGYEQIKTLFLKGVGDLMKRIFYSKFKEEIKCLNKKLEDSHTKLSRHHFGIKDIQQYDYQKGLDEPLDIFSTNDQEMFFLKKTDDEETTTTFQLELFKTTQTAKKSHLKIDGINYALKHVIRNYHSPRNKEKGDRKMTLADYMSGKTFKQSTFSYNGKMPSLDFEGFSNQKIDNILDDSSPFKLANAKED